MRLQLRSSLRGGFNCCLAYCGLLFRFWLCSFFGLCAAGFSEAGFLFRGDEFALRSFGCVGGCGDGVGLGAGVAGSFAAGEVERVGGVVAGEEAAGVGAGDGGDLLGRAVGDDAAAAFAALGPHVEDVVGVADDVEVMLDDDDGVAEVG